MPQTPFHAYYKARLLEQLPEEEQFIPVFASSDIEIYPFQIAAASFALRSPYAYRPEEEQPASDRYRREYAVLH